MIKNLVIQKDLYSMYLNLPHRRLIVDDTFRLISTPPLNKVYPSSGCLFERCPFTFTCNKCVYSYDINDL